MWNLDQKVLFSQFSFMNSTCEIENLTRALFHNPINTLQQLRQAHKAGTSYWTPKYVYESSKWLRVNTPLSNLWIYFSFNLACMLSVHYFTKPLIIFLNFSIKVQDPFSFVIKWNSTSKHNLCVTYSFRKWIWTT